VRETAAIVVVGSNPTSPTKHSHARARSVSWALYASHGPAALTPDDKSHLPDQVLACSHLGACDYSIRISTELPVSVSVSTFPPKTGLKSASVSPITSVPTEIIASAVENE